MERTWRLLWDEPAAAAWNMAVDEAVAAAVGAGDSPPTLRLYAWRPAAVSVGYFQRLAAEVDLGACRDLGFDWVRRPTGGRAVLHAAELTYAVAVDRGWVAEFMDGPGGVLDVYARWSRGLIAGVRRLGAAAEWAAPGAGRSAACFDAAAAYEVAVAGRKLVGSAQVRRWGAVLQHGSLPLHLDRAVYARVLRGGAELEAALQARACALDEVCPRPPSWREAAEALAGGFASALGIELVPGALSPEERAAAADLARGKYASPAWNGRR